MNLLRAALALALTCLVGSAVAHAGALGAVGVAYEFPNQVTLASVLNGSGFFFAGEAQIFRWVGGYEPDLKPGQQTRPLSVRAAWRLFGDDRGAWGVGIGADLELLDTGWTDVGGNDHQDIAGAVGALGTLGFALGERGGVTLVFGRQLFAAADKYRDGVDGYVHFSLDDRGVIGVFGRAGYCHFEYKDEGVPDTYSSNTFSALVGLDLGGIYRLF